MAKAATPVAIACVIAEVTSSKPFKDCRVTSKTGQTSTAIVAINATARDLLIVLMIGIVFIVLTPFLGFYRIGSLIRYLDSTGFTLGNVQVPSRISFRGL